MKVLLPPFLNVCVSASSTKFDWKFFAWLKPTSYAKAKFIVYKSCDELSLCVNCNFKKWMFMKQNNTLTLSFLPLNSKREIRKLSIAKANLRFWFITRPKEFKCKIGTLWNFKFEQGFLSYICMYQKWKITIYMNILLFTFGNHFAYI